MKRRIFALACGVAGVGACSVLNAPDDLKPAQGAGATAAGGAGNTAGTLSGTDLNQAGASNDAGAAPAGVGGCGVECAEGGAPPLGRDCTTSGLDCSSTAPICDAAAGTCRACQTDQECHRETGRDFCLMTGVSTGRCVACKTNSDCVAATPICGTLGICGKCRSDDECESGVCDAKGACATPDESVYALAETGLGNDCGTIDKPCSNLSAAALQLTATRHNLVLIKTTQKFIDAVTLPAVKGLRVIGNGVSVSPYNGASAFTVPAGAGVLFDNVVVSNSTGDGAGGIVCTGASINVNGSTLDGNAAGILATDCDVAVSDSLLKNNAPGATFKTAAIWSACTTAHCAKTTTFVRNKFLDNGVAVYLSQQASATIENNLFLRNGFENYTRVLELVADQTRVAYNTLVENFNNGIYVGIVACNGGCTVIGNISFNNFPGHPEYAEQVFYGNPPMSYNLTEVTYPGATNKTGDPKFIDAAKGDYTPGAGSPALDKGDPKDFPPLDLNRNGRPGGNAPDIGAVEAQ